MQVSKVQSQILVMVMCSSWGRDEHLRKGKQMIEKGKRAEVPSNTIDSLIPVRINNLSTTTVSAPY